MIIWSAYCECLQSGVDKVEGVVEVWQLVEQQPGPGAGQGAGRAGDNVVPATPTRLRHHRGGGVLTPAVDIIVDTFIKFKPPVLPRHGGDVEVAGLGSTVPRVHGVVVSVQLQRLGIIHLRAAEKMVEAFSLRQLIF